jgi:hypothetical protein
MEHEQDQAGLIELGTASIETQSGPIGNVPEALGLTFVGLSDE